MTLEMRVLLVFIMVAPCVEGAFQPWGLAGKAPYYHTSEAIHQELVAMSMNCSGAKLSLETLSNRKPQEMQGRSSAAVELHVATISSLEPSNSSNPPLRAFLLFGEHARELVSAESGLDLVRTMCGASGDAAQQQAVRKVLKSAQVKVVVNANPKGRLLVEDGKWCHRGNGRHVDLNRNWDDHFRESVGQNQLDSYPGPSAFSESETRELQDLLQQWQPQLFLAVHSGIRMLAYPHGYSSPDKTENGLEAVWKPEQQEILRPIAAKYCPDCEISTLATGKQGYAPAGTSMDYAFDKLHTHFSFVWEIYERRSSKTPTAFLSDSEGQDPASIRPCFPMFNPTSRTTLAAVVKTWTSAYLDLIEAVALLPKEQPQAVPPQKPHSIRITKSNLTRSAHATAVGHVAPRSALLQPQSHNHFTTHP